MKRRSFFLRLILLLIGATLAFIWSRSLKSMEESAAESAAVTELLRPLLELFVGRGNVTNHLVRKLAHFCEYALLGAEIESRQHLRGRRDRRTAPPILVGFLVAAIDENIQYFVGRGNRFSDVLLDCFGFLCGTGFVRLLLWLKGERKEKNG